MVPSFPGSQPFVRPAAAPGASPLAQRPRWKALAAWGGGGCRGEAAAALRCRSNVADSTAFGHPGARERRNAQKGWLSRSATTLYFALWYLLSIGHSVTGKQLTNALPLPWSVAAAQIVVGALFTLCLWLTGLRTPPTGTLGGMARNWPTHPKPTPNPNPNP